MFISIILTDLLLNILLLDHAVNAFIGGTIQGAFPFGIQTRANLGLQEPYNPDNEYTNVQAKVFNSGDIPQPSFAFGPGNIEISVKKTHSEMSLAAVHLSINVPLHGIKVGQFNRDMTLNQDEEFTTIISVDWKLNDVIYYWIYVIVDGKGYQKLSQSYTITESRKTINYNDQHRVIFTFRPNIIHAKVRVNRSVSLVAIHMNLNTPIKGTKAGRFNVDMLRDGNHFTTEISVAWNRGDVIYYWIHEVIDGLGYNTLNQQFVIPKNADRTTVSNTILTTETTTTTLPSLTPTSVNGKIECGKRLSDEERLLLQHMRLKVTDGYEASTGEIPWQVQIQILDRTHYVHHCGAVIISSRIVLTAAHCITVPRSEMQVIVGQHDVRNQNEPQKQAFSVQSIIEHPKFEYNSLAGYVNDIALLLLRPRNDIGINFGSFVQPVCIPPFYNTNLSSTCFVSGWGKENYTDGNDKVSPVLRIARVPIISPEYCGSAEVYGANFHSQAHVCAGYTKGGKDACSGDSGGPLSCLDTTNDKWYVTGIVSWGDGCGKSTNPGVYTKVSNYHRWIQKSMDYLKQFSTRL